MSYPSRLPRFEYAGPESLAEVLALVADAGQGQAMLLAGGTDAILQLRRRERRPRLVIGLKRVAEMNFVREQTDDGLAIGATTTLHSLLRSSRVCERYGVLAQTAAGIGGIELRNVATVGGNIAGALPCADLPPALMVLDAQVVLSSPRGERRIALEQFFPEFGRTAALENEVLSAIRLPPAAANSAGVYIKYHDRASMDMTVVGVAAFVVAEGDVIRDIRLALANSAPTVFRARSAEALVRGSKMSEEALEEIADALCREVNPRTSWRANGEYRRHLVRTLARRAVRQAWRKSASGAEARA